MISAFAKGYAVLGDKHYLEAAERAVSFLLSTMYDSNPGQLLRRFCLGEAAVPAFLDDYAFLAQALIDLFEAGFNSSYLETAVNLAQNGFRQFEDIEQGGFFSTASGAGDLLLRMKDDYDGAEPSGNSVAADVLLRLAHLTGDSTFRDRAEKCLRVGCSKIGSSADHGATNAGGYGTLALGARTDCDSMRRSQTRSRGLTRRAAAQVFSKLRYL